MNCLFVVNYLSTANYQLSFNFLSIMHSLFTMNLCEAWIRIVRIGRVLCGRSYFLCPKEVGGIAFCAKSVRLYRASSRRMDG